MLRTLVCVCSAAAAIAAPVFLEPMSTAAAAAHASSFDVGDSSSFDPLVMYEEGRHLAEESEGRELAETTIASTKKVAGASGPGQMGISSLRYKLSQSYCPHADSAEQSLLACKNQEIGRKVRAAKEDAVKKKLVEERKALYAAAAKQSDADKKKAAADHKVFYAKAYGKYCAGANSASDVCTNELMKKMYGGAAAIGAKKAKKKKA